MKTLEATDLFIIRITGEQVDFKNKATDERLTILDREEFLKRFDSMLLANLNEDAPQYHWTWDQCLTHLFNKCRDIGKYTV
jgi:hypothetical protein